MMSKFAKLLSKMRDIGQLSMAQYACAVLIPAVLLSTSACSVPDTGQNGPAPVDWGYPFQLTAWQEEFLHRLTTTRIPPEPYLCGTLGGAIYGFVSHIRVNYIVHQSLAGALDERLENLPDPEPELWADSYLELLHACAGLDWTVEERCIVFHRRTHTWSVETNFDVRLKLARVKRGGEYGDRWIVERLETIRIIEEQLDKVDAGEFEFLRAPLVDVLTYLSKVSRVTILMDSRLSEEEVSAPITMRLKGYKVGEALEQILDSVGIEFCICSSYVLVTYHERASDECSKNLFWCQMCTRTINCLLELDLKGRTPADAYAYLRKFLRCPLYIDPETWASPFIIDFHTKGMTVREFLDHLEKHAGIKFAANEDGLFLIMPTP